MILQSGMEGMEEREASDVRRVVQRPILWCGLLGGVHLAVGIAGAVIETVVMVTLLTMRHWLGGASRRQ
jgi:hypothetical protein